MSKDELDVSLVMAAARAAECVRACAPFDDPQADIPALIAALREAKELIGVWHGMGDPAADESWPLYQQSPEMRRLNAALARVQERR